MAHCNFILAHTEHRFRSPSGLETCEGVTKEQENAAVHARKTEREDNWRHLVEVHELPMLTYRAYTGNRQLWNLIHDKLHALSDNESRYKQALQRIADEDYRGPEPFGCHVARETLDI